MPWLRGSATGTSRRWEVCMEVLLDPVTPPCGHSLDPRCMQKLSDAGAEVCYPTSFPA